MVGNIARDDDMTKILPAKLSISRVSGSREYVSITVEDESSHCTILELELDIETFGKAVLGYSYQRCEATWCVKNLGLKYEHKTENVPWDSLGKTTKEEALAPFETDGWKGRLDDLGNPHKHVERCKYKVVFTRYVKP